MPWVNPETMEPRPRGVQDAERRREALPIGYGRVLEDLPFQEDFEVRDPDGEPTAEWPVPVRGVTYVSLPQWVWYGLLVVLLWSIGFNAYYAVQAVR